MTTCISSLDQYYSFLFRAPVANACKHICAHLLTNLCQLGGPFLLVMQYLPTWRISGTKRTLFRIANAYGHSTFRQKWCFLFPCFFNTRQKLKAQKHAFFSKCNYFSYQAVG